MDESGFRQWAAVIRRAFEALETSSYYQVLGVRVDDPQEIIRKAFHRRAAQLHPDRHRDTPEPVRTEVYAIYKRMTEAYRVLLDPDLRRSYDSGLTAGRLRLTDEVAASRPKSVEDELKTPSGRSCYRAAKDALASGDLQGAELSIQLALSHEGPLPLLVDTAKQIQAQRALRKTGRNTIPPGADPKRTTGHG